MTQYTVYSSFVGTPSAAWIRNGKKRVQLGAAGAVVWGGFEGARRGGWARAAVPGVALIAAVGRPTGKTDRRSEKEEKVTNNDEKQTLKPGLRAWPKLQSVIAWP